MNTICGSPLYMAPEIIKHKKYTIKSDIWSFGVIIYEMIYGYMPIKSDNIYDLISFLKNKNITFMPSVSYDCIDLMKVMLQKDQNDRISWNELFNHKWLNNNILLKKENKLLEIKINSSIENLNSKQDLNLNNSYKYTSISEKLDDSLDFNLNFNFNYITDNSIKSSASTISNSLYLSLDNSDNENSYYLKENTDIENIIDFKKNDTNPITISKSKNINIPVLKDNSFVMIYKDEIESYDKKNNFENKTLSENLRNYFNSSLNNSITFVKQSYDYINKSSSL